MFCENCGKRVHGAALVCQSCGSKTKPAEQNAEAEELAPGGWRWRNLVPACLALAVLLIGPLGGLSAEWHLVARFFAGIVPAIAAYVTASILLKKPKWQTELMAGAISLVVMAVVGGVGAWIIDDITKLWNGWPGTLLILPGVLTYVLVDGALKKKKQK